MRQTKRISIGIVAALLLALGLAAEGGDNGTMYHKQGNSGSGKLMSLPLAAMAGHLSHGDNRGCYSGARCVFDDLQNLAIGGARLALNGRGNLIISDIDGSGTMGVRQDPLPDDSQVMITGMACPNFLASAEGTKGVFVMYADVPGDVFSVLTVENIGPGADGVDIMRAHGDFSPIGATSYTIQVYNGDELVADIGGLDDPTVIFPKDDIEEVDCTIDGRITYERTDPGPITIAAAGVTVLGDRFCFIAEDATVEGTRQTAIDNFFTNTGPVEMTFQVAGPFGIQ